MDHESLHADSSRETGISSEDTSKPQECKLLKKDYWLQDVDIEAANKLLRHQFPELLGLYSPLLGQNLSFPLTQDPFVQILHVRGNHWLTVAGMSSSLIYIYDSRYDHADDDTRMLIAAIVRSNQSSITLKIQPTQFQLGSYDCGLYAIAYATDLAYGNDPASLQYTQKELREHFWNCLPASIFNLQTGSTSYPGRALSSTGCKHPCTTCIQTAVPRMPGHEYNKYHYQLQIPETQFSQH